MAVTAASLIVKVSGDTGDAESKLSGIGEKVASVGGAIGAFSLVAGGALVAAGVKAVMMAGDFQAGMTSLVTGAGESRDNIKAVSDGILNMAGPLGTTTQQLTDGMYMIESAGFHGAAGLDVLKNAAMGAKVGNAQLGDVANGVTTEMVDYASTGLTAAAATNVLIATVADGKTHMQDLATAMSTILPVSSATHVSLIDTAAAMATMTGEGTDAATAATYLKQMLIALDAPGSAAKKVLAEIGVTSQQVSDGMKTSLPATLDMLTSAMGKKFPASAAAAAEEMKKVKSGSETMDQGLQNIASNGGSQYIEALKSISGGSKDMIAMLDLTGTHMGTYKDNVTDITDKVKKGGNGIQGWADVQKDFNFKIDQARGYIEKFAIKVGTNFLPILSQVLDHVKPIIDWAGARLPDALGLLNTAFAILLPPIQFVITVLANVLTGVANFVGFLTSHEVAMDAFKAVIIGIGAGILISAIPAILASVVAFGAQAIAAGAAAIAVIAATLPFVLIAVAIGAVIFIVIELVKHWNIVKATIEYVARFIASKVGDMAGAIGGFIGSVIGFLGLLKDTAVMKVSEMVMGIINGIASIPGRIGGALASIGSTISSTWNGILASAQSFGSGIVQHVIDGISGLIGKLGSAAGRIGDTIKGAVNNIPGIGGIANWAGFAEGTDSAPGGLAMVGERGPELVYLPRGAQVTPNNRLNSLVSQGSPSSGGNGGSGGGNGAASAQPVNLILDGRILGTLLMPYVANAIRYNVGTHS